MIFNLNIVDLTILLHHEINNSYINIFYYFIKLSTISSCTKFIRQELYFPWFLKSAITLDKISSRIKLGLRLNF